MIATGLQTSKDCERISKTCRRLIDQESKTCRRLIDQESKTCRRLIDQEMAYLQFNEEPNSRGSRTFTMYLNLNVIGQCSIDNHYSSGAILHYL